MVIPANRNMQDRTIKLVFLVLCALLLVFMLWLVPDFGSSGDELSRNQFGKSYLHHYFGIFVGNNMPGIDLQNSNVKHDIQPYGALFDGTVNLLSYWFKPSNEYTFRHYCNAIVGFISILLAALISKKITGKWGAAILTVILFVITPRYFGECFNNPKDIPFAATALFFTYRLLFWLEDCSTRIPSLRNNVLTAVALLLPMCIRPGGLLFIGYFGIIAAYLFFRKKQLHNIRFCITIALIIATAYFGCVLFWPQALLNPLTAPLAKFKDQSRYLVAIHVLFEGKIYDCKYLPWYYTHKLLFITTPLIILIGFFIGTIVGIYNTRYKGLRLIICMALFPLLMIIIRHTVLYDGIRQILFVLAYILLIASIGLWSVINRFAGNKIVTSIIVVIMVLGLYSPIKYATANHPNEYIYYNELVGGLKNTYGRYEGDYYYNSAKQAFDWLKNYMAKHNIKDTITIISDCDQHITYNYNKTNKLPIKAIHGNISLQNKYDWDYAIFFPRFLDSQAICNAYFNSPKTIHEITADGISLCKIYRNDSLRLGHKGQMAFEAGNLTLAEQYWHKAAQQYPWDTELWTNLSMLYLRSNKINWANWAINNCIKTSSINRTTAELAWQLAIKQNNYAKARRILTWATQYYQGEEAPWARLAEIQVIEKDINAAEKSLEKAALYNLTTEPYYYYNAAYKIALTKGADTSVWLQKRNNCPLPYLEERVDFAFNR